MLHKLTKCIKYENTFGICNLKIFMHENWCASKCTHHVNDQEQIEIYDWSLASLV